MIHKIEIEVDCLECEGSGYDYFPKEHEEGEERKCTHCKGTGRIREMISLRFLKTLLSKIK